MKDATGYLPIQDRSGPDDSFAIVLARLAYGAITWPWLLRSLWGGTQASKRALLRRLDLCANALPKLGSWKADTFFLHTIVDQIEMLRPRIIVELGAGATTLVAARALALNGGGRLVSYDQHRDFVASTADWLRENGCEADLRYAPLTREVAGWPGRWYETEEVPDTIDMLIIDGPPWTVHPRIRGAAECLFERLSDKAVILLDDAARPGERSVAATWRQNWPEIHFVFTGSGAKGTLVGTRSIGPP